MRIVKLSKEVFGFDTIEACRAFFKHVIPFNKYYFGIAGEGNHIAKDGLKQGEIIIFSYDAKIVSIALNERLVEEYDRVKEIKLSGDTLKVFDYDICLRKLEEDLKLRGYDKKIVGSQGWNIIEEQYEKNVIDYLISNEWKHYI